MLPVGPAAGELDQCFPPFSSVLEQILSWNPKSTLHCIFLFTAVAKIFAKLQPSQRDQNSHNAALPKYNSASCAQFLSYSAYSQQFTSRHLTFFLAIVFFTLISTYRWGTL